MAGAYLDMQNRIADEINRSDLGSQIQNAIQTAILYYETEDSLWFTEGRFLINTVASQDRYVIPDTLLNEDGSTITPRVTLLDVDQMVCNFNNWFQPLKPVTWGWIDTYQIPTYTGQPYYYGRLQNMIRFAPTPNGVYQVIITGTTRLPTLVNPTDTNAWMTEGEWLIRSRAKAILWRAVLRDMDEAKLCEEEESLALAALQRKESSRITNRASAWGY